jgi:hypothetical protein
MIKIIHISILMLDDKKLPHPGGSLRLVERTGFAFTGTAARRIRVDYSGKL